MNRLLDIKGLPLIAGVVCVAALVVWFATANVGGITKRVPGTDGRPEGVVRGENLPQLKGKLETGEGVAADLPGSWPQFRGPNLTAISDEAVPLATSWGADGPSALWEVELGEGFAGAAVHNGRVYLIDYDRESEADVIRCLSLGDGSDLWRFSYPVRIKRDHGMSRTVPAVTDEAVVALGPKCHLTCLDAVTGELKWAKDLVHEYGTEFPRWYTGQCPFIEDGKVIVAPAGNVLMTALDLRTGEPVWETPNPNAWAMTHSSITPMDVSGQRTYVYCAKKGVVGVSADDGQLLWETDDWRIGIATVPSPVVIDESRLFFAGGYNAGALMLEVTAEGDTFTVKPLFRLAQKDFGSIQHTPILFEQHLYGVRPNGDLVCLDLEGNVRWASGPDHRFGGGPGGGPYMLAGDKLLVMDDSGDDSGTLSIVEATPSAFRLVTQAKVLEGREPWAPMALASGLLLVRELEHMVCLDVRG